MATVVAAGAGRIAGRGRLDRGPPALAAGAVWLWRAGGPRVVVRAPPLGLQLAMLAVGIAALAIVPLQLGSPVPPHMDVLATSASAQRIVTFGHYWPFDNDPYGYWTP